MNKILVSAFAAGLAALAAFGAIEANAQEGVEVGSLNCTVAGGVGFIFGSSKALECVFTQSGHTERYSGSINKYGIDIGITGEAYIAWAVFAPRANLNPGALAGDYGGTSAEASAGIGGGANILFGGDNSITLQPLSLQGQSGLNVAAGISSVNLQLVR